MALTMRTAPTSPLEEIKQVGLHKQPQDNRGGWALEAVNIRIAVSGGRFRESNTMDSIGEDSSKPPIDRPPSPWSHFLIHLM